MVTSPPPATTGQPAPGSPDPTPPLHHPGGPSPSPPPLEPSDPPSASAGKRLPSPWVPLCMRSSSSRKLGPGADCSFTLPASIPTALHLQAPTRVCEGCRGTCRCSWPRAVHGACRSHRGHFQHTDRVTQSEGNGAANFRNNQNVLPTTSPPNKCSQVCAQQPSVGVGGRRIPLPLAADDEFRASFSGSGHSCGVRRSSFFPHVGTDSSTVLDTAACTQACRHPCLPSGTPGGLRPAATRGILFPGGSGEERHPIRGAGPSLEGRWR